MKDLSPSELVRVGFYSTLGGVAATSILSLIVAGLVLLLMPVKPVEKSKASCGC